MFVVTADMNSVVIKSIVTIPKPSAAKRVHGVNNGVNYSFVAAFREIGNALNQCGHNWQE